MSMKCSKMQIEVRKPGIILTYDATSYQTDLAKAF